MCPWKLLFSHYDPHWKALPVLTAGYYFWQTSSGDFFLICIFFVWLIQRVYVAPCDWKCVSQITPAWPGQMASQAKCCPVISSSQWPSKHQWICQHKINIHSLTSFSLAVLSCNLWEHFSYAVCCIWHSGLFTPFPVATFFLVLLTYPVLQFLDGSFKPGNGSLFKWAMH